MTVQEKIKEIIQNHIVNDIDEAKNCTELGIDSLDLIEVIMQIEREFNIAIPDEEIFNLQSLPIHAWGEKIQENMTPIPPSDSKSKV